jgi:hypothetical protein
MCRAMQPTPALIAFADLQGMAAPDLEERCQSQSHTYITIAGPAASWQLDQGRSSGARSLFP